MIKHPPPPTPRKLRAYLKQGAVSIIILPDFLVCPSIMWEEEEMGFIE